MKANYNSTPALPDGAWDVDLTNGIEDTPYNEVIYCIFGGTGSLGSIITEVFIKEDTTEKIILVTNNEQEIWESKNLFKKDKRITWVLLDIRDREAIILFFSERTIDIVFNCAALKHVVFCEEFPMEAVKTNILGLDNIISRGCVGVEKFIQISTDKAVESVCIMGATKFIGERLVLQANKQECYTRYSVVRLGNVLNSRGSLIPQLYSDIQNHGKVFLTDDRMMRFFLTKEQVWTLLKKILGIMNGGEIFIPKMKLKSVYKLIRDELGKNAITINIIGKQRGERLVEHLYSFEEGEYLEDLDDMWVIRHE